MYANCTNQLVLKSINQLFEYSFYIPSYQRGYRWTETQVIQLLKDVWDFAKNPPQQEQGKERPFYCLQPIVVKKRNEKEWEVIDGQQRLTTIYLILKNLENQIERDQKNFSKISYESRVATQDCLGSEEFLKNVEKYEKYADQNIDFFHIFKAFQTIHKWFQEKANSSEDASPRAVFTPILLRDTKVIWYEVEEIESNDSIDIFTRLNIGKIPLTNAELIKALFLQKGNFSEEKATLKQLQIASEWDNIEKTLQDDSIWYFLYNPENPLKYENRIEYIFDLMKGRTKESEYYHTFNAFFQDFTSNMSDNKPDIDNIWLNIKRYFLTFEEWYKDYELFHYVGFLIDCGISINTIKDASNIPKNKFKEEYLKGEIRKQVKCKIDEIEYGDKCIKRVLLLFNIVTVLETQKSDMRFPFHKYKSEDWDIEHICSQTDKSISIQKIMPWVNDIILYFAGSIEIVDIEKFIIELDANDDNMNEIKLICKNLLKLKKADKIEFEQFSVAFKLVQKYFKEDTQIEEKNSISNLALLDAATNRSYGNSFFPIKRKRIIENDSKGIFVPIATKNLFLKYYSKKLGEVMYWNKEDAKDYLDAIKKTLKDYLPKEK
jgi:uncharacterized protein with ParB-like and HNH nuclease domain